MTPQSTTDQAHWQATVAVRVPETDGGNLAAAASRRLARGDGIEAVDDVALQAIEPGLAATVARVAVVVRTASCREREAVEQCVADAPGVQRVEDLEGV
jgi:hypothetical protein